MKIIRSNIWDVQYDYDHICITTNSVVNAKGLLIMGKGIALQALNQCPELRSVWGQQILKLNQNTGTYGLLEHGKYIAFQTKRHWRDPSPIDLIIHSTKMLNDLALKNITDLYALPFPGINNGQLSEEQVLPLIQYLPNNVHVFKYP